MTRPVTDFDDAVDWRNNWMHVDAERLARRIKEDARAKEQGEEVREPVCTWKEAALLAESYMGVLRSLDRTQGLIDDRGVYLRRIARAVED